MVAQIQEFRFNDRPWRIDWFGRIIYSGSSGREPRIAVYLSELSTDFQDPLSNESLGESDRHKVVTVKIGLIALLKIGSVWTDGVRVPPRKAPRQLSCVLSHDQCQLARFDSNVTIDGVSQPLFSAQRYRIGIDALREVSGSWVVVIQNPTPRIRLLAIPSTAIFQKCLATSPKAIRRLVYGELDKIVDPKCGFLDDQPDTYFIELFKDFRDTEGPALANLKAEAPQIGLR